MNGVTCVSWRVSELKAWDAETGTMLYVSLRSPLGDAEPARWNAAVVTTDGDGQHYQELGDFPQASSAQLAAAAHLAKIKAELTVRP